jgi:outer membrane protein OmpA-like peptidoglycan-associated protein
MRTYPYPGGGLARALRLLGAVVLSLFGFSVGHAQERTYLLEVGAAGAYQSYGNTTDLGGTFGGLGRVGVWLPLNFSIEVEGTTSSAKSQNSNIDVGVKTGSVSLLYNIPFGARSWGYGKLGYGGTRYGSDCDAPGARICGPTSMFVTGVGVRVGVSPILMMRAEGALYPNRGTTRTPDDPTSERKVRFSNYGVNLGVSVMLGSKPIPDSDGDGILNNRDRCAGTPSGAQVDGRGCPADTDGDGVANGLDRCPNTAGGALVDAVGCTQDSDGDNIADGIDKCPDTQTGVLVDANGCPRDSDEDTIADGLDRCSDTPKGATVDALGCPGDEDSDGVLDGLDRCPRTPVGVNVNAAGCVQGQPGRQPAAATPDTTPPPRPQQPQPAVRPAAAAMVLENVTFGTGSARLQASSYGELDSIAKILVSNPNLRVEIGGHTDASRSPADDMHLSTLRAEAVRNYLVAKGVPFQQVVARGYGSTVPLTPDTTPRGRAANRRVELRPLAPGS